MLSVGTQTKRENAVPLPVVRIALLTLCMAWTMAAQATRSLWGVVLLALSFASTAEMAYLAASASAGLTAGIAPVKEWIRLPLSAPYVLYCVVVAVIALRRPRLRRLLLATAVGPALTTFWLLAYPVRSKPVAAGLLVLALAGLSVFVANNLARGRTLFGPEGGGEDTSA